MNKSLIVVLLAVSMCLEGCSSYSLLTEQDKSTNRAAESEPINFVLNDGSQIEADAYHHINLLESGDFIYGIGEHVNNTGLHNHFQGKLLRSSIDSTTTERTGGKQWFVCWLSDSSHVRFSESDYFEVTPEQGVGFWCIGTMTLQNMRSPFRGKVPTEMIVELQIKKFSITKTVFAIIGIAIPPTVFLILWGNAMSHIN